MHRAGLLLLIATSAFGIERGKLVENLPARSDATQTYTLYLPAGHEASRKHPVLLVFDPRGRGTKAAEIFREAAEEYGWIIISSNQTRSDGAIEPNERAVRALLPETAVYGADPKRIYAAGFSGTAILAWQVGIITRRLAGVIGVGGRLVDGAPPRKFNFAHYGFAGENDFNNREMRMVDEAIEDLVPHRFEAFPGAHEWIAPRHARAALGWFEVLAGNDRVRANVLAEDLAEAKRASGLASLRRYRAIQRTYGGVETEIASLTASTQAERADEEKWDEWERQYTGAVFARMPQLLATIRAQEQSPSAGDFARAFRLKDLRRRAAAKGAEGATARRLIEAVHGQASFYLPAQFLELGEPALAAAVLEVAVDIHSDRIESWYQLAAAHARAGNRRQSLHALRTAVSLGFRDAPRLDEDDAFADLRSQKQFQELVKLASGSH